MTDRFDAAVLHDFFVDRVVFAKDMKSFLEKVASKASQGGGGIHGIAQSEVRGGNAVNLAHALARLGLRTLLITHSDREHQEMLRAPFEGLDAEIRIKDLPPGLTVALEGGVNVMLGHGGGASKFGPSLLDEDDWRGLGSAKVVCQVNWAANSSGNLLAAELRKRLGARKTIFMDPADFRERTGEFRELLSMIRNRHLVDWLSLNEQEALAASRLLSIRGKGASETCRSLAKELGVAVDVHTESGSYASSGEAVAWVRGRRSIPARLTGAGDVWDGAAIYGRLAGMKDFERMRFANAAARLYVESSSLAPPTYPQVIRALR